MLILTKAATHTMIDLFKDKDITPVRISILSGGCGMRFFALAPSESTGNDEQFNINGFTYLVDRKIILEYAPITIDSDGFSFRLSGGGIHPPNGCGTCAFGCSLQGKNRCNGICHTCKTPCRTGRRKITRSKRFSACLQ